MENLFKDKCLICKYYTDDNGMDECKIWACSDRSGIAEQLEGCKSFKLAFEECGYDVDVFTEGRTQRYYVENDRYLRALVYYLTENGVDISDIKAVPRLKII